MKRAWLMAAIMLSGLADAQLLVPRESDPLRTEATEYGLPLPLTAEAVNALPAAERERQASAIKRVCLLQQLQCIQDGYTITDGNRMATIECKDGYYLLRTTAQVDDDAYQEWVTSLK